MPKIKSKPTTIAAALPAPPTPPAVTLLPGPRDGLQPLLYRLPDLVGQPVITPEAAEQRRALGKRHVRPRAGRPGLVGVSAASIWRWVKAGTFPAPVKLSAGTTAWRASDVHAWLQAQGGAQ